ncbi:hypothetical protein N0V90_007764 [Kalmusia sp. IMI 367209]|nr:hypothetical protein N0V90_007764 [Kalmusia sp. IMI 367209]
MNVMDPETTPAQTPPDGVLSNFKNPDNYIMVARLALWLCLVTSSLLVFMRIWSRFVIQKAYQWDDYSMILAWAFNVAWIGLCFHATRYGGGVYHLWDISQSHLSIFLKLIRLLCPHRTGWTYFILWFLIVVDALFYFAINIATIWSCNPRSKIWHPTDDGTCINLAALLIIGAVVNFISDISILVLPIWKVWQLQLSTAKKIGVTSVFSTGLFACIASIMRLFVTTRFIAKQNDVTLLVPAALWAEAEITSGIICGCLPAVPAIFRHFVPKLKSSIGSRNTKRNMATSDVRGATDEDKYGKGSYIELYGRIKNDSDEVL